MGFNEKMTLKIINIILCSMKIVLTEKTHSKSTPDVMDLCPRIQAHYNTKIFRSYNLVDLKTHHIFSENMFSMHKKAKYVFLIAKIQIIILSFNP